MAALLTKMSDTNISEEQNATETEENTKASDELDTPKTPEMVREYHSLPPDKFADRGAAALI